MGQPKHIHVVVLNAEAWAAAEELTELAGLRAPGELIETMLLDLRESTADTDPREELPANVIPISRGRRKRRSCPPPRSGL